MHIIGIISPESRVGLVLSDLLTPEWTDAGWAGNTFLSMLWIGTGGDCWWGRWRASFEAETLLDSCWRPPLTNWRSPLCVEYRLFCLDLLGGYPCCWWWGFGLSALLLWTHPIIFHRTLEKLKKYYNKNALVLTYMFIINVGKNGKKVQ